MSSSLSLKDLAEKFVTEIDSLTEASQIAKEALFGGDGVEKHFLRIEKLAQGAKEAFTLLTGHKSFPWDLSVVLKDKIQSSVKKWHAALEEVEHCAKDQIERAQNVLYNNTGSDQSGEEEGLGTILNESL
jgi:predicted metal-dependent hydrolase